MNLIGWVSLAAIWWLFFWAYRDYRLDKFRQKLFELRDQLFDLALDGEVDFNSPAYGMLRSMINGTIQFGHRLGFMEFAIFSFLRTKQKEDDGCRFVAQWNGACDDLPHDTREKLMAIRHRMHLIILEQVIFTSATLVFTLVALAFWVLIHSVNQKAIRLAGKCLSLKSVSSTINALDFSAAAKVA